MSPSYSYDRRATTKTLDLKWVEGLRKDFLTLLKNVDRVQTYRDLDVFRTAVKTYRNNFDYLFFDRFLNKDVKEAIWPQQVNAELRGPAWAFMTELSVPGGYPDDYWKEETILHRFKTEAPKWKARLQRKARDFWTSMKKVIEWYAGRDEPSSGPTVNIPERHQTTLEGFKVILHGYASEAEGGYHNEEILEKLKEGLKLYRERASRVAPILLKMQLPVIVDFETTLDKGGVYNHNGTITFYGSSVLSQSYKWVTHVMAHEMGHHLFRAYLSTEAQKFWMDTIRGDYGDIDLKELLDKWPGNAWAYDMPRAMKDDPVLALQVSTYSGHRKNESTQSKEDFQALYDKGVRTLNVPKTPITGYAGKNSEEAFCEAIGLLVAYGPRAVHERVRWWLDTAMPGQVRVASLPDQAHEPS
jgi:hypothetical protein